MKNWKDKKVTVLGLGKSGLASAKYLKQRGADVLVSEYQPRDKVAEKTLKELEAHQIASEFGGHSDEAIQRAELFLISPGIPPSAPVVLKARGTGYEVISDIELAYRELEVPIIAITGTNGKSTTTSLISYILEADGKKAPACGNIGVPILSLADQKLDFLVAEVSSFQLEYAPTFAPDIGVWLNLSPDHLDWHADLDEYIEAKRSMFAQQKISQFAVLNSDDPLVITSKTVAEILPFSLASEMEDQVQAVYISDNFICCRRNMREYVLCHLRELGIRGAHNAENALAAVGATILAGANPETIDSCLKSFKALEHRLEYVDTIDGIAFYNDSKATNTVSTIKALEAFPQDKVVLIAGGKDKGIALGDLIDVAKIRCAAIILIGEATNRFQAEFNQYGIENIFPVATLEAAVKMGLELGLGPVVLSPACSSFDMFKNYEERGRVFKDIVRARSQEVAASK